MPSHAMIVIFVFSVSVYLTLISPPTLPSQVLKAPTFGVLSADQMRTYVSLRAREMAGWLELPGSKSNTLRLLLSRGAALMVFDRRRPLAPAADLATVTPVSVGARFG